MSRNTKRCVSMGGTWWERPRNLYSSYGLLKIYVYLDRGFRVLKLTKI